MPDQRHQEQALDDREHPAGARRKSSGRRRVSTIAATTAAAIGQRDSAYADSREAGSIGSVPPELPNAEYFAFVGPDRLSRRLHGLPRSRFATAVRAEFTSKG
jgi:hypothetical protein